VVLRVVGSSPIDRPIRLTPLVRSSLMVFSPSFHSGLSTNFCESNALSDSELAEEEPKGIIITNLCLIIFILLGVQIILCMQVAVMIFEKEKILIIVEMALHIRVQDVL
jgi:hypothetical protein